MKRAALVGLAVVAASLVACATPGARGPAGDHRVFPAGDGSFQVVVRGDHSRAADLLEDLHAHAGRICGVRGYSISEVTTDSSSPPGWFETPLAREATVSAVVRCGLTGSQKLARLLPATDPDGRPYCPELDPEVETLRPAGYLSAEEQACVPRPKPEAEEQERSKPPAATRQPVVTETGEADAS